MHTDIFNPTPEHSAFRQMVRNFAEQEVAPQAAAQDRIEALNAPLFAKLADLGLLGITVPAAYGGAGRDACAAVIAHEELAAADSGFTLAYLTHAILFADHIARNGNEQQRRRYLPDACTGRIIGGMAMTEPDAGTDLLGMKTTARRDGDCYVLNGAKMFITNAVIGGGEMGDAFLVYARSSDQGIRGISLFVVEKGTQGFRLGTPIRGKLGVRGSTSAQLLFENCVVPLENRVGAEGTAVLRMMRTLEMERLTMAAMGLGIARRALEIMNRHATNRTAFGEPIRHFGQIQRHIGESYAEWMAGRAYVYQTARRVDDGSGDVRLDADGVKLYCSTMAKRVADCAIQVLGGRGYIGDWTVERLWRDAKLLEIGGGTLEAHQRNITRNLVRVERLE